MKRILIFILAFLPTIMRAQGTLSELNNMHVVTKGETLQSVAAFYGVTPEELSAANPDINRGKIKRGQLLIIPQKPQAVPVPVAPAAPMPVIRTSYPSLRVGVLLPFSGSDEERLRAVDFYRGLLMAADSIKREGGSLQINAWDSGTLTSDIQSLLPGLKDMDIVFGPTLDTQAATVADYCRSRKIRLVLPFTNATPLQDSPLVYVASSPNAILYADAADMLVRNYSNRNYVFVSSGDADSRGQLFTETLSDRLYNNGLTPRKLAITGDDFAYESAFNQFRDNIVIIDNTSSKSLGQLISHLNTFRLQHPAYRITLIGYPEWQSQASTFLSDFHNLDTHILSPYYFNIFDDRTRHFQKRYESAFKTTLPVAYPRYSAFGFDLAYYFLHGLLASGDTFEQMQNSLHYKPYQNDFIFRSIGEGHGFYNHNIQLIHYTNDQKIELIR